MIETRLWWMWLVAASISPACISTPPVNVVSRQTAVVAQSAGEMPKAEYDLAQSGLKPGPEPSASGASSAIGGDSQMVAALRIHRLDESDESELERLQSAKCVGEANTGLLVTLNEECELDVDAIDISRRVGRANVHREQLWTAIAEERSAELDSVRDTWRSLHLQGVSCGSPVQLASGVWEDKTC